MAEPHLTRILAVTSPATRGSDVEAVRRGTIRYLDDDKAWAAYVAQPTLEARTYGPRLAALVKRVEKAAKLKQDGVAGPRVDDVLRDAGAYDAVADRLLLRYQAAHAKPRLWYPQMQGPAQSICQGIHESAGLGDHPGADKNDFWAQDFCAPGGTIVVATFDLAVTRWSGHDPATGEHGGPGIFGWSMYVERADGVEGFLTHMGARDVAPGSRVRAGGRLGTVGHWPNDPGRSHTHYGVKSPKGVAEGKALITAIGKAPKVRAL